MLIKLVVENWMSFRDKTEVSMIATREQQFGETLTDYKRRQARILPMGVFFGGNASGKTNLFLALAFLKDFITGSFRSAPDSPIHLTPFLLDEKSRVAPSFFSITILAADNNVYEYSLKADRKYVYEESLERLTGRTKELSYTRKFDLAKKEDHLELGKELKKDETLYQLMMKATRPNRLFLSTAIMQNADALRPVYDWFRKTLQLISPKGRYGAMERYADRNWIPSARMTEMLSAFDTGIAEIKRTRIERAQIPLPPPVLDDIERLLKEGVTLRINNEERPLPYLVTRKDGEVVYERISAYHKAPELKGGVCEFEIEHESAGTKRILEILPAFVELEDPTINRVYVIDEIDCRLHALATRRLIKFFKDSRTKTTRSQLLATTHALSLMDQELLRRDEMWLIERSQSTESSSMSSVSDFQDARKDLNLCRSYLEGRMGGLPAI